MKKIFFSTFFLLFTLLIISCDISSLGLKSLSKEDFNEFKSILDEMTDYIISEKGEEVISEKHQKDFKKEDENVDDEKNED